MYVSSFDLFCYIFGVSVCVFGCFLSIRKNAKKNWKTYTKMKNEKKKQTNKKQKTKKYVKDPADMMDWKKNCVKQ